MPETELQGFGKSLKFHVKSSVCAYREKGHRFHHILEVLITQRITVLYTLVDVHRNYSLDHHVLRILGLGVVLSAGLLL